MKVLVLGGTGAMGEHLVQLLADENIETYVTSRKKQKSFGTVRYVQGNAHDTSFISTLLLEKFNVIVDFMIYTTLEFSKIVKSYLENTDQYIFLSSARVYADSITPLTEDSPRLLDTSTDDEYLATDEYALTKARQENLLIKSGKNNWTIIRPYITYSENRLQLGVLEKEQWLNRTLYGHTVVFPEDIMRKATTLTYGFDVAKGIKSILGNTNALGQTFNITNTTSILWSDVLDIYKEVIFEHTGKELKIKLCKMKQFEKIHRAHYQIHLDRMYNRKFDITKINKFINTNDFLTPQEGLKRCVLDFIQKKKYLHGNNFDSEGRNDYLTKEYWNIADIPGLKNKLKYIIRRIGF